MAKKVSKPSNPPQEQEDSELIRIGQKLKEFRESLKTKAGKPPSQKEFAKELAVLQSKVARYELGQSKPDYSFMIQIGRRYGLKRALEIFEAADLLVGAVDGGAVELTKPVLFKAIPLADGVEGNRLLEPEEKGELVYFIARLIARGMEHEVIQNLARDFLESHK